MLFSSPTTRLVWWVRCELILPWQRRLFHPQPEQWSEVWSHSPRPLSRSAESNSSPEPWRPPEVIRKIWWGNLRSSCLYMSRTGWKKNKQQTTSKSWLATLKWVDDVTMLLSSRLSITVPEVGREKKQFRFKKNVQVCPVEGVRAAPTVKLHVPQVKDSCEQFGDFPWVILSEHQDLQSWAEVGVLLYIITSLTAGAFTLVALVHGSKLKSNQNYAQKRFNLTDENDVSTMVRKL